MTQNSISDKRFETSLYFPTALSIISSRVRSNVLMTSSNSGNSPISPSTSCMQDGEKNLNSDIVSVSSAIDFEIRLTSSTVLSKASIACWDD